VDLYWAPPLNGRKGTTNRKGEGKKRNGRAKKQEFFIRFLQRRGVPDFRKGKNGSLNRKRELSASELTLSRTDQSLQARVVKKKGNIWPPL